MRYILQHRIFNEFLFLCVVAISIFLCGSFINETLKRQKTEPVIVERLVYPESMDCPIETRPEREHFILLCIDNAPETLEAMRLCISTAKTDYCDVDKVNL